MTHKVTRRSGFPAKKAEKQPLHFERCQPAVRSVETQNPAAFPLDRHRTKVHKRKLLTSACHLHAPVSSYHTAHFGFSTFKPPAEQSIAPDLIHVAVWVRTATKGETMALTNKLYFGIQKKKKKSYGQWAVENTAMPICFGFFYFIVFRFLCPLLCPSYSSSLFSMRFSVSILLAPFGMGWDRWREGWIKGDSHVIMWWFNNIFFLIVWWSQVKDVQPPLLINPAACPHH